MRKRKKGRKFSRKKGPRKALLRGLANQLILNGQIKTTLARAKEIRPLVERMVTKAKKGKRGGLAKLRSQLDNEESLSKLVQEIGPRYRKRPGGYLRILKLGPRQGDSVEMALIKFVEDSEENSDQEK